MSRERPTVASSALNRAFDALPRTRFGHATREVPAFRTCGVVGYYVAVVSATCAALLTSVSLLVVLLIALVCAASFYVYVYVRRWITGRETLELLDQVWFSELCTAGALLSLDVPLLPYLDVLAVALCPFLAAGRVGCTLVGCCHGRPSSVGLVYGQAHVRDGFPPHLVGIRLFPVPALEAVGLALIGFSGLASLPFAPAGQVFAWFLTAYAVLRFGLEWLRGDVRPHWLGLSKPQWMALTEFGVGVWVAEGAARMPSVDSAMLVAVLATSLVVALFLRRRLDDRRAVLAQAHTDEVRRLVAAAWQDAADDPTTAHAQRSSAGVSIAVSGPAEPRPETFRFSVSRGREGSDLTALCELATRVLPPVILQRAQLSPARTLHLLVRPRDGAPPLAASTVYGDVVRRLQREAEVAADPPADAAPVAAPGAYFASRTESVTTTQGAGW